MFSVSAYSFPPQTMATWFYYNEQFKKITVTGNELKELAKSGVITPETIVETEEGKRARAGKVKGLNFAEAQSTDIENVAPPVTEELGLAPLPPEPVPVPSVPVPLPNENNLTAHKQKSFDWGLVIIAAAAGLVMLAAVVAAIYFFSLYGAPFIESTIGLFIESTIGLPKGFSVPIVFLVISAIVTVIGGLLSGLDSPSKSFCTNCGKPVTTPAKWFEASPCKSCGAETTEHNKFCRHCGTALNPEQVVCVKCNASIKNSMEKLGQRAIFSLLVGLAIGVFGFMSTSGIWKLLAIVIMVIAIADFLLALVKLSRK